MKSKNNDNFFKDIYRTLTPFGWSLFFVLIVAPLMIGWTWGYHVQSELLKIQSQTNGMEHSTNYEQLHGKDSYHAR